MKVRSIAKPASVVCLISSVTALTLAVAALPGSIAHAEAKPSDNSPEPKISAEQYQTLYLTSPQENDARDIVTDLRNMLPKAKIYYVSSQNAISFWGTSEDIHTAQKMLSELDRPRKIYRLTYTITDIEDGKRTRAQNFTLVVPSGGETNFKQGSKVPIVTGSTESASVQNSQVQYLDIGLHIQASLEGTRLHTKVEQSRVSDEKSGFGAQDPIVHQTVLDGISSLTQGKPVVLGSLDIPDSTRREEIEVVAEAAQ
jgi:type II secretory pathway component GspD/PulD (secretin)